MKTHSGPSLRLVPWLVSCLSLAAGPAAWSQEADPASFGSLDGARVAYAMPPGERVELTFITSDLGAERLAELREAAPNVRFVVVGSRAEAMDHAARAHGADARFVTAEFIEAAPNLVWVLSPSAGVDRYVTIGPLVETERIVLTNMRAVHGPTIADHSMAMLLALTRHIPRHLENQREGRWGGSDARRGVALQGRTMFVVGLGGIGSEIAVRARGFGMRIIASRRSDRPKPDYVDEVGTPDRLLEMLPEADVVAIALPLTDETAGLFDRRAFGAMKPGSYLINIARGGIVDTEALMEALDDGRLAGAGLDVTDPEPLPADHPLWGYDNVIITPHVAGVAELTSDRWWALYRENVRRFGAGEPLLNTVDKRAGY